MCRKLGCLRSKVIMTKKLAKMIEDAKKLYTENKYEEVVSIFSEVLKEAPDYADGWKYLGSSLHSLKQYQASIDAYRESIKLNSKDAYSWRELGNVFIEEKKYDEAKRALEKARYLNGDDPWVWRYYARLHRDQKQYSKEVRALLNVELLEGATPHDLNTIGIAFHNNNEFFKALDYYYKSLIAYDYSETAPLFNMALVYGHPDISQDIDAVDSYQRVLNINPTFEKANAPLKRIIEKLIPIAQRAKEQFASLLIADNDHYKLYINPFEAFDIEDFDAKIVHRARKRLLSEIELNNGRVSWLSNQFIDKSHVYRLEEEILDDQKREYHWAIYNDKRLLNFLSKGTIELFLYDESYLPEDIIKMWEGDEDFRIFLSSVFAGPYDFVLSRAIDKKAFAIIEALFDGRRWVIQEDVSKCFIGAQKWVRRIQSDFNKVTIGDLSCEELYDHIKEHFKDCGIVEIFNLLPSDFHESVSTLIAHIRSLAVDAYNKHNDSVSSKKILHLCKLFKVRSPKLSDMLNKDFVAIEKIVSEENEEKKLCISLLIKSNSRLTINRQEIQYRDRTLKIQDIEGFRLMSYTQYVNGVMTCSYKFSFRGSFTTIDVEFSTKNLLGTLSNLFRSSDEVAPIESRSDGEQRAAYEQILNSIYRFVVPSVGDKLVKTIESGGNCSIGHCRLNKSGITFSSGMIFSKEHTVPWDDLQISVHNGRVVVATSDSRINTSLSVGDTDNAILFPILCKIMTKKE